jgi:hypothetical protein
MNGSRRSAGALVLRAELAESRDDRGSGGDAQRARARPRSVAPASAIEPAFV